MAAWADVGVVAFGELRLPDAPGLALLVGVLGKATATALAYVVPALRGRTNDERSQITTRMARGTDTRAAVYNLGALAVVAAAVGGADFAAAGAALTTAGWTAVTAALAIPDRGGAAAARSTRPTGVILRPASVGVGPSL